MTAWAVNSTLTIRDCYASALHVPHIYLLYWGKGHLEWILCLGVNP